MTQLSNDQRAYLESLKEAADSPATADALEALAMAQMGLPAPLNQSLAVPSGQDTKPSGWFWRRFRR